MDNPEYVSNVFTRHWNRVEFPRKDSGCVAMELGCGDSLASCHIAAAYKVKKYYLLDAGKFASMDMALYRAVAKKFRAKGISVPDLDECDSVPAMLSATKSEYLTDGLRSLQAIESKSVDFIWSQAVLEHVRRAEFQKTMKELRRILRDDGVMSHRIDLRDHLSAALNNLRFSARVWESSFMANSGFYTNRIRYGEMIECMRSTGFDVQVLNLDRWNTLPTPRQRMAREFRSVSEEDLLVSGFDVLLRPI
jgi:SAM-dependent methyltransferase